MLGITPEAVTPPSVSERIERFIKRTGFTPEDFAIAWRAGEIPDNADNAAEAIESLALRAAR